MQNLDPSGQYSDAEVKAALSGANGHRNWSFRYSRLDKSNNFIEDIDYVQTCTINNDFLADIKRTAKFNILDTGSLNYLSDRIQPHVRLTMPPDVGYGDYLSSLQPAVWWKLDDPTSVATVLGTGTVANGNTFNTSATADLVNLTVNNARSVNVQQSSGTLRSEYWSYITTSPAQAIEIETKNTGTVNVSFEIYSANSVTDTPSFIQSQLLTPGQDVTFAFPIPLAGVYFLRTVAQSTTSCSALVSFYDSSRLEDSSGNGVYGVGYNLGLQSVPVVSDGGHSLSATGSKSLLAYNTNILLNGGFSINYWISHTAQGNEIRSEWGAQGGYFDFYVNDDAVNGVYNAQLTFTSYDTTRFPNYNATLAIPNGVLSSAGAKMVTLSIDPNGPGAQLFINGLVIGTFVDGGGTPISAYTLLSSQYLSYGVVSQYSAGTLFFDDYSMYTKPLTQAMITTLYQKGSTPLVKRSGFVEWPQGIFLLSSPKRTMVQGNVVMRQVDAYDQLLVLKEDSFDRRTAFAAGTKYVDAIRSILQAVLPPGNMTIDSNWSTGINDTSLGQNNYADPFYAQYITYTPTSVNWDFPTNANTYESAVYSRKASMIIDDISISAKIVTQLDVPIILTATVYDPVYVNAKNDQNYIAMSIDSGGVWMHPSGRSSGINIPYNATTHAYIRMRESKRTVYFETSPDGINWTLQYSGAHPFQPGSPTQLCVDGMTPYAGGPYQVTPAGPVHASATNITIGGRNGLALLLTDNTATMPAAMEWEPGTTKLQALNDMLAAINYESGWFDENGMFRARPYILPTLRGSEFKYATDASSVITGDVDQTLDIFKIPNKWVLTVSEPDRSVITSTYVNSNPTSPTSTISRGRTIVSVQKEQTAVDQATLDARAARLAFEASQVYEEITFKTGMMPMHSNNDVYTLHIDGLSVDNKYLETSWSMDLNPGSDMTHTVRRIVQV